LENPFAIENRSLSYPDRNVNTLRENILFCEKTPFFLRTALKNKRLPA